MSAHLGPASCSSLALRSAARAARPQGWMETLAMILRCVRTRQDLAEMEPRLLRDLGLTPEEARREARRAPWDVGPHRG